MMPQYIHFLGADSHVAEAKLPLCFITIQATFCMNHALYAYIPDGVEDLFEQFPHLFGGGRITFFCYVRTWIKASKMNISCASPMWQFPCHRCIGVQELYNYRRLVQGSANELNLTACKHVG